MRKSELLPHKGGLDTTGLFGRGLLEVVDRTWGQIEVDVMRRLVIFFVFLLLGCSNVPSERALNEPELASISPKPSRIDTSDLRECRRKWEETGILDYDMTVSLETTSYIEPARALDISVRTGKVVSVQVSDRGDERGGLGFYRPYLTVETTFDHIAALGDRTGSVSVKYNRLYGYPEEIEYFEANPDASFKFRVVRFKATVNGE